MNKFFVSATLFASLFFGNNAQAQYDDMEVSYGVKAGYGFSTLRTPRRADVTKVDGMWTFNFTTYMDIPVTEGFSIQPGLAVNGKGATINVLPKNEFTNTEYKSNPVYLELPVNFVGKIALGDIFDKCNIIFGGGPYVSYGIAGKQQVNGKLLGSNFSSEDNIIFSNDDQPVNSTNFYGQFKKYDFGLNALAGIEYHWATFNINYSYGAVNVNPGANLTPTDRMKNRVLSASIGVRF